VIVAPVASTVRVHPSAVERESFVPSIAVIEMEANVPPPPMRPPRPIPPGPKPLGPEPLGPNPPPIMPGTSGAAAAPPLGGVHVPVSAPSRTPRALAAAGAATVGVPGDATTIATAAIPMAPAMMAPAMSERERRDGGVTGCTGATYAGGAGGAAGCSAGGPSGSSSGCSVGAKSIWMSPASVAGVLVGVVRTRLRAWPDLYRRRT
jgi:hypothetical protein